jgi:glycosyltransferase involved in cell wall biosynthesis
MRILYHHRTLLDGAERVHITEMIRAFEALGHEVTTFAPAADDGGQPGIVPRMIRKVLPQGLFEGATAGHDFVERRQARRLVDEMRAELVYKRHALNSVSTLVAANEARIPSVLEVNTVYSSDALQPFEKLRFRRLAARLEARAFRMASLVIAVSSPMTALVQAVAPDARTMTVPNGADPTQFSPSIDGTAIRQRQGLHSGALVAGWSGTLRSWHGVDLLLRALALRDDVELMVIGDGPDRPNVEAAAARLGVGPRVRFVGRIPREEVPRYLAAVDIGVVADDRTGYASPLKLLEYMAMGKAVVAPNLPNIRDIVTDGREGLLFEPRNADALARCLERLRNADFRQVLGRAGRARVVADRNWQSIAASVIDAVQHGVDTHTRRAG